VDVSLRGVLRRLGLGRFKWSEDRLVSWKYVQPFSVEDAITTDKVTLSITRKQMLEMPSEDLADVLEELSGKEQQALFSALDSEKAAEALSEAEPRAQRQIIANIRAEKARNILSEMTIPQLVGLFSVLPHADVTNLMAMLSDEQGTRVREILSRREIKAVDLLSSDFWIFPGTATVEEVLTKIRHADKEQDARSVSYIYVVDAESRKLLGVVDLREIILARDSETMEHIMAFPVVTAEVDDSQEDLAELFAKYHYRTIPVVDPDDHILGVIYYNDIMKGIETRLKI
jgi:Mg/Co/Ni transporter MgtE